MVFNYRKIKKTKKFVSLHIQLEKTQKTYQNLENIYSFATNTLTCMFTQLFLFTYLLYYSKTTFEIILK